MWTFGYLLFLNINLSTISSYCLDFTFLVKVKIGWGVVIFPFGQERGEGGGAGVKKLCMICEGGDLIKKNLPLKEISSAHRRPSRGAGGVVTPEQKLGGENPPTFWCQKPFLRDVYDNTCDNVDFRLQSAHFLRPQTTQELPKKHHEAVPPE